MGKKNIFIGLSTLLLALLLGLSTRTYANTISLEDMKNFCVNVGVNKGLQQENVVNWVDNSTAFDNFETWAYGVLENPDYDIFICSSGFNVYVYYANSSNTNNKIVVRNTTNIDITVSMNNYKGFQMRVNDNNWTSSFVDSSNSTQNSLSSNYFYSGVNMYEGWTTTIWENAPVFYTSSAIFEGPYSAAPTNSIRFEPYPTKISDVYVGQNYNLTAYGCNKNNTYVSMRFGDLIQPPSYLIEEINITMSYYNRGLSKWVEKYLLIETGDDLVPSNYKSSIANFKWENYEDYTITFSAFINNEYVHEDCLYSFTFIGKDTSDTPFYIEETFYIIGSNTVITDGILDIGVLTTGDYANDYANDLNDLAKKIDDQNDLINAVEQGNINSWLPGSGDWSALIGLVGSGDDIINTANLWGFRNYSNSYWTALYEMMNATYTVLSQSGTVSLDVSFHGYNHAITSADIPSPPLPIKNTISLCLITFVMISIYKSFSKKIEKLKMVDTSVLKSEAHDDSDLM